MLLVLSRMTTAIPSTSHHEYTTHPRVSSLNTEQAEALFFTLSQTMVLIENHEGDVTVTVEKLSQVGKASVLVKGMLRFDANITGANG